MTNKVQGWTHEITRLAEIATTQPHAAYAAFTHGHSSRWSYISRTIPDIHDLLLPLETVIHQCLITALTGRAPCSRQERDLLALPVRLGGLGLTNPATNSSHAFQASERLTAPLAGLIVAQSPEQSVDQTEITAIKKDIQKTNRQRQEDQAKEIHNHLNHKLRRSIYIDLGREKGSSAWLSVLPLEDHNFYLHKGEFRDALCLRYGWTLSNTPHTCNCGTVFSVDHAMIWHMGGFPTIRHNEIRDITASLHIECGVFTPIVFTTTGREAATFYKRLADMIAGKQQKPYSTVMGWLRCRLSFATLRSAIMCVRGSRSSRHRPIRVLDITLATAEGHVPTTE